MRVLLDPTAGNGGGAAAPAPNPAAPPNPTPATPAPGQPPATPQAVSIPYEHFQLLSTLPSRLAEYEAREQERERVTQEQVTQAMLAKGQVEEAFKAARGQFDADLGRERAARVEAEGRARTFARDTELARSAAGLPFVSQSAAKQLIAILSPQLEAHPEGSGFAVRTATFQTPEQLLSAARTNPEFAHFFAASTQGGIGAGGAQPAPTGLNPGQAGQQPRSLGEEWARQVLASRGGARAV